MLARRGATGVLLLLSFTSCRGELDSPLASRSRPPAAGAAIVFASGSWSNDLGAPRELMAIAADGSGIERLTTCTQLEPPCDALQIAVSPERTRLAVVRTAFGAEAGASALYFMDLGRSVEKLLLEKRRVSAVDWSSDSTMLIYSAPGDQTTNEDLFLSQPNGSSEENLMATDAIRERNPRFSPSALGAVYERIDESGVSRIYAFFADPLTSGPAAGPALPGTPYVVGADADPAYSPDGSEVVFRRLTGIGNGGLGTWDLLAVPSQGGGRERTIATGPAYRGAPDWTASGILFVETDVARDQSQLVVLQADGSGRVVLRSERVGHRMQSPRWLRGN